MVSPFDDLDLTQAQAYALQPGELAELLGSVDASLSTSLSLLRAPADVTSRHRTLHDLKGYLGLVASRSLCELVQQADQATRQGPEQASAEAVQALLPRLVQLHRDLQGFRAGIIGP